MPRLSVVRCALLALVVFVVAASTAAAAPPTPENEAGHDILGVVPSHPGASKAGGNAGSNLTYHGGPVVRNDATYAIYWQPAGTFMSTTYKSLLDGFFTNVAGANTSGSQASTYFSDTQYTDGLGAVSFAASSFGGSVVDTNGFPASGCSDSVSQTTTCLSDTQLTAEIDRVITANNWPRDRKSVYFIFTPKGVGSCYASSSCAFSSYCAYHSNFRSGTVLYANQPYTGTVPSACGSGQSPNGDADADSTINVTSHEHNEAITDPLGNAWFDRRGYENADKCAWNFGSAIGSTGLGSYNQSINGGTYYLQQNWSNRRSGCVLTGL